MEITNTRRNLYFMHISGSVVIKADAQKIKLLEHNEFFIFHWLIITLA